MFPRVMCAVALAAFSLAAQSVPIGGGTSPRYCGSAWFTNSSGAGVCEGSHPVCTVSLQNAINLRLGWGWTLQSTTPCSLSQWWGPPYTQIVAPGGGNESDRVIDHETLLAIDVELRERFRIDEYEAELQRAVEESQERPQR
jgi:hypothetical protein